MSTTTITRTKCDLCGYDSSNSQLFTNHGGFDFCRWCMSGPIRRTESGGHAVDIAGGSWSCSCGVMMSMVKLTLWRYGVDHAVMAAVPHLDSATAAIHVQTPNWPQTW